MLLLGLTGGIGAGKSTLTAKLAHLGAMVVDADQIAREVVAPGTPGLDRIVADFGASVLGPEGDLDRPALARVVFSDPVGLRRLEAITHPLIAATTAERIAAAPPGAIVVHDMPLIVEKGSAARHHLVIVVHTEESERLRRLVELRGMSEEDARARIDAQADDEARRAVADVWIDNTGAPEAALGRVEQCWIRRFVPYTENLRLRRPAPLPGEPNAAVPGGVLSLDPPDAAEIARVRARIDAVVGPRVADLHRTGDTTGPVLDLELVTEAAEDVEDLRGPLTAKGLIPVEGAPDGALLCISADPGRPVRLSVRARD